MADGRSRSVRIAVNIDDIKARHLPGREHIRHIAAVQQLLDPFILKDAQRLEQIGDVIVAVRKYA